MNRNIEQRSAGFGRGSRNRPFLALMLALFLAGCAIGTSQSPPPSKEPTATRQQTPGGKQVDPRLAERLQKVMVPLIQHMNKPVPLNEVKVGILDSKDINAANAGGGEFYVTMGLLEKANDDQLRGVLAHEVAHDDLGHVAKAQAVGTGLNIGMIILDQILPGSGAITPLVADLGVMKPFSRKEEYEADTHGVEILNRTGHNGKEVMAGTLKWLMESSGPSGGFFATHPGTQDRIKRVENMAQK